jgi:hypothetical protein
MPQCKLCDKLGATVEFRRSKTGGYLCKDKYPCSVLVAKKKKEEKEAKKNA